jgi:hypothetical protein
LLVKKPRALEHHVDAQARPGQLRRIALRKHLDAVAVHHHRIAVDFHLAGKLAVRRVVACEVCVGLDGAQVVHRDDLQVVLLAALVMGAEDVAADAAVAVDGDADGHCRKAPGRCRGSLLFYPNGARLPAGYSSVTRVVRSCQP